MIDTATNFRGALKTIVEAQMTWSAWVKVPSNADEPFLYSGNTTTGASFGIGTPDATNYYPKVIYHNTDVVNSNFSLTAGQWYLFTWVRDTSLAAGLRNKIYINGKETGYSYNVGTTGTTASGSTQIGAGPGGGVWGSQYFSGQIDDVRIYNYALSATQVQKLYTNGSGAFFGPVSGQP